MAPVLCPQVAAVFTPLVSPMLQVATIGDVSDCTFLSNAAATDGPAVYAFNCAGRIFNNAFANEPVNAVRTSICTSWLRRKRL